MCVYTTCNSCPIVGELTSFPSESVWHPDLTKARSEDVEYIQKRSLNTAFPNCHYMDGLGKTGLESLEQRRESQFE